MVFFLFKCLNSRCPHGTEKWKSARKLTDEEVLNQELTKKHGYDLPPKLSTSRNREDVCLEVKWSCCLLKTVPKKTGFSFR